MTERTPNKSRVFGRRQILTAVGAAGLTLGGANTAAASASKNDAPGDGSEDRSQNGDGGKSPLGDIPVDVLVYWSSGDDPNEFDYPAPDPGEEPDPGRGLFFAAHDPAGGGLFDYTRFELTPNGGTLHNDFELFQGALLASDPKPYPLVHRGDGEFESRGQVVDFEAREYEETPFAQMGIDRETLPPIDILAGEEWRAVGTDVAKLETDEDGEPTPHGEWGVTRVDVYDRGDGAPASELSLLYLIREATDPSRTDPDPGDLIEEIPDDADAVARELIEAGTLNVGGQPRGRDGGS